MLYAIVHKNRVIIGPMDWSQKYFTSALKIRHRIDANIPGNPPENLPYEIDSDTRIHLVIENKPSINDLIEYHYGPIWDLSNDVITANYEIRDIDIESARNNFRQIAAAKRYTIEVSGTKISIQNKEITLDTSRDGRNIFIQKFLLMNDTDTVNWKFPEGWLTLTKSELGLIVSEGANHIQNAFNWEQKINLLIDQCQTLDELVNLNESEIKKAS